MRISVNNGLCCSLTVCFMVVKYLFVAIIACWAYFASNVVYASDSKEYMDLIHRMSYVSVTDILCAADSCLADNHQEEAMVLYMIACNRLKTSSDEVDKQNYVSACLRIGDLYYSRTDYIHAMEFYLQGLKVCESTTGKNNIAELYKNIGNVYCMFFDFEKGFYFYDIGYKYCAEYPDHDIERRLLVNLTGLCIYLGRLEDAQMYYKQSLFLTNPDNSTNQFMDMFNQGMLQAAEGHISDAVRQFKGLLVYAAEKKLSPQYVCSVYQELYKTFLKAEDTASALFYLDLCENVSMANNIQHLFLDALRDKSDLLRKIGRISDSKNLKIKYLMWNDSIYNQKRFDVVKNIQFQYEMSKVYKEIEKLNEYKKQREHTIRYLGIILISVCTVAFLVVCILLYIYNQKKKLNRSYMNLYNLNQNYIDSQEYLKQRRAKDREQIANLTSEIAELKRSISVSCDFRETGIDNLGSKKYQSSNLNEIQQTALADAITSVMENTEEFCSDSFSLDYLAMLVNSNSKYVSQVINETFHKNFNNYVNEYRIHLACKRLTDKNYENYTVKAIGESLGYKSHTSFVNIFRKITGLTPSVYQRISKDGSVCK